MEKECNECRFYGCECVFDSETNSVMEIPYCDKDHDEFFKDNSCCAHFQNRMEV